LLDEKINERHKPSVIVHGVYSVENKTFNPFNDGRIHVVYAGTFDPNKGGARASILSSKYLSEKFHLHILGFGNHSQLQMVNDLINQVQSQTDCVITNDGLLKGSEFTAFLQKCQIGLSTQDPNAIFNDTSFPSKILTYLANGLKVVSADMNVVRTSQVVDGLFFYSRQEPELIANAIIDASKARNIDISDLMRKLDKQFYSNLYKLLAE
jgi:glycosyltransferase involved in cell wall biosynthesis